MTSAGALARRLAAIKLLVVDVDGVLTDGTLYYGPEGEALKAFHVHDGLGMKRLAEAGVEVAVITARESAALARRMKELGVGRFFPACRDKEKVLAELVDQLGIDWSAVGYVGDDLVDLAAMRRVGLAIAVADARPEVRVVADWVTRANGGRGAVREVADAIVGAAELPFRVVIPARYGASRLPGKPLREIAGRPMIAHVLERAAEAGAAEVIVATDDARIADAVTALGGTAEMTSEGHSSGTDRLAEVAHRRGWDADSIVVNLQGDEPCMPGELIQLVARSLAERPGTGISTLAVAIEAPGDLVDPNVVKVVLADDGQALYFSRAPIPWVRDQMRPGVPLDALPRGVTPLRHLGLYGYRVETLLRISAEEPREIERAESLEQLRALALGIRIHVDVVERAPGHGVDTEDDLARVEALLAGGASA